MADHMNYIAGWRPSSSGVTFEKRNPADTGHVIGEFPESTRHDFDHAYRAARDALPAWRTRAPISRAGTLARLIDRVADAAEEYAALSSMETGQPEGGVDVAGGVAAARAALATALATSSERRPRGVIAVVTPWNFPVAAPLCGIVASLAAGNAVVVHPSPLSPWCAERILEDVLQADVPPGVCNLVHGTRGHVASVAFPVALAPGDPGADWADDAMYPSTPRAGRTRRSAISSPRAGSHVPPNPGVVLADADLALATTLCREGVYRASGQRPDSLRVLFAARERLAEFEREFAEASEAVVFDDVLRGDGAFAGPLIDDVACDWALAWRERVRSSSARVLVDFGRLGDARHRTGRYLGAFVASCAPDVALRLALSAPAGPHAIIAHVEGLDDAITSTRMLADIFAACVCTRDGSAARAFADGCPAPFVAWNTSAQRHVAPQTVAENLVRDLTLPAMLAP